MVVSLAIALVECSTSPLLSKIAASQTKYHWIGKTLKKISLLNFLTLMFPIPFYQIIYPIRKIQAMELLLKLHIFMTMKLRGQGNIYWN